MMELRRSFIELLLDEELDEVTAGLKEGHFFWDLLDLPHNSDGSTPLISACQMGLSTVMHFLLENGADVTLCNHNSQTALHVSQPGLRRELLAALSAPLAHHAKLLEVAWRGDMGSLQHLLTQKDILDVNIQNRNGLTALMLAVRDVDLFEELQEDMLWRYQPTDVVKTLLDQSANMEIQDQNGYNVLYYVSQIKSSIKDELLQVILEALPQTVSAHVELQCNFPADLSANSLSSSSLPNLTTPACVKNTEEPLDNLAVEESERGFKQDKSLTLFIQSTMEPQRSISRVTGWTSSLPNLQDRSKCWTRLSSLHSSSAPTKTSLLPLPPTLIRQTKPVHESSAVPYIPQLSQSAPSLAVLDASVLLHVRENIYNRLSSGETDNTIHLKKAPPPVLCPRTPRHLAPLDVRYQDVQLLQRPAPFKPISILPSVSVSRQRRERFSRLSSRGSRRGSAESSSQSSLDLEEEEEEEKEEEDNGPQESEQVFRTLARLPQNNTEADLSGEHSLKSRISDITEDTPTRSQFKRSQEVEDKIKHNSVHDYDQNEKIYSADLDKVVEVIGPSSTSPNEHTSIVTKLSPASENVQLKTFVQITELNLASVGKLKPIKTTKGNERKCRPFQSSTNQSFNILAHRNASQVTGNPKRKRRNSSISAQAKVKDGNPVDYFISGENPNKDSQTAHLKLKPQRSKLKDPQRRSPDSSLHTRQSGGTLNKSQSQKQLLNRESKIARQVKTAGNLTSQRAKSTLDCVSYSDMFVQIHQSDKGPAIFEMFATPLYENLRVGSSADKTKQVQTASQMKRQQSGQQRNQKSSEGSRRKQTQKCSHAKNKQRKKKEAQASRAQNQEVSLKTNKEDVVIIFNPDGESQSRRAEDLTTEYNRDVLDDGAVLSVIEEVLSNPATQLRDSHSVLPPYISTQINSNEVSREAESADKLPPQPRINTWTSDSTRSPVYQKFLNEVGDGPVTDDLLRCLAEELISLEEKEVETLKPGYTENNQIRTDLPAEIKKKERTSSSDKLPRFEKSRLEDSITWTKGEVLGRGAYGTVFCGLTSQGALIAVKQVVLDASNSETAEKEYNRLEEEVDLLKNLHHLNIVGFLGTALSENVISIFMEYVPGGSISNVLHRFGPLPEKVFALYTRQILEGVAYLHDNRVIHRDLKGNNIMLMPTGIIKLIDFGCARRLNCLTPSGGLSDLLKSVHGTPYWMAPEVISETGHGRKSDIWSVGCTVFEMATGKPPLAHMGKMAALFYIGARKGSMPSLPEDFSEEAKRFVQACLTSDQKQRPSAEDLLRHPFILHLQHPKNNKHTSRLI